MKSQNSPIIGYSSLSKQFPSIDQQPDPVQVLQQKLEKLEEKYLNFVDRCSDLLKSDKISKEAHNFIFDFSSSFSSTPDPVNSVSKDSKHLMKLLKQLENGNFFKELMTNVAAAVQASHDTLVKQFLFTEKIKSKVKESQKALTAEIWQNLFLYENYVQMAARGSVKIILEFEKLLENDFASREEPWAVYKDKYKKCREENLILSQKLIDIGGSVKPIRHGKSSQQNLGNSRSLASSPSSFRQNLIILGEPKEKRPKNPVSALGKKETNYSETVEIQEQLKNLQQKLQGFEMVAKNLIDKSLKAEKVQVNKKINDSNDFSIPGANFPLLDRDKLENLIKTLELEKENLERSLRAQRNLNKELLVEKIEKEKEVKNLAENLEKNKRELTEANLKIEDLSNAVKLKENAESCTEKSSWVQEREKLEKIVNGLNESKKVLSDKIKEKDLIADQLNHEIQSSKINYSSVVEKNKALKLKIKKIKEEKLKIISFSARHAENAKNLDENMKNVEENLMKAKENERKLTENIEKSEKKREVLENNIKDLEVKEKSLIEKLKEMQKLNKELSIEAEEEREKRENSELKISKQRKSAELNETEKFNQLRKILSLENLIKTKEEEKKNLENLKKSFEKSLKESKLKEQTASEKLEKVSINLAKFQNENEALAKQVTESWEKNKDYLKQIQFFSQELGRVKEELEKTHEKLLESENTNSEISGNLSLSGKQLKDLEEKMRCKESLLQSLQSSLSSNEISLNSSQISIKSLESKLRTLESSYKSLDISHKSLEDSSFQDQITINDLKSSVKSLEYSKLKSQENEETLKSEIESLKSLVSSSELLNAEVLALRSVAEQLKSQLTELEPLKSSLKSLESQLSIKDSLLKQRSQSLFDLQVQHATLESSINTLNLELKSNEIQIENLQKKTEKIPELHERELSLSQDLQTSQKSIQNLQAELKELKISASIRLKSENSLKDQVADLTSEKEELKVTISNLSENLSSFKNKAKKIQATLKQVKSAFLRSEIFDIKNLVLKKFEEFRAFISNPYHVKNIEGLLLESKRKCEGLSSQNSGLYFTIQRLNKKCDLLSKDLAKKQEELENSWKNNEGLNIKINELVFSQENLQDSLRSCSVAEESIQKYQKKIEFLTKEKETLSSLLETFQKDLKISQLQQVNDQEAYTSKLKEKINQIIQLTEQNDQLTQTISVNSLKISELEQSLSDFEDLKEKVKMNHYEFLKTDQEIQNLQKKLEEKSKELEKLNSNLRKLRQDFDKTLRENKKISLENQRLAEIQIASAKELKEFQDKIDRQVFKSSELLEKIEDKERINEDLKNALINLQLELDVIKGNGLAFTCDQCLRKSGNLTEDQSCPLSTSSKTLSLNINPGTKRPEGLNFAQVQKIKTVKHGSKCWTLLVNEAGLYFWKEVNAEIEADEDLDEIKKALGGFYSGNIVLAISELMKKADGPDYSVHLEDNKFDLISQSFQGEIFEAGLELSKIDLKIQEAADVEFLTQELSQKNLEILQKNQKIEKKKRTLMMHKEQLVFLKEQIRIFQEKIRELEGQCLINVPYLKQVFCGLITKVKADKEYENLVGIMFKMLGLSNEEIVRVQSQRKGGKKLIN